MLAHEQRPFQEELQNIGGSLVEAYTDLERLLKLRREMLDGLQKLANDGQDINDQSMKDEETELLRLERISFVIEDAAHSIWPEADFLKSKK